MNKLDAIGQVYRIAMLEEPGEEICALLHDQTFERALELLLVLRQAGRVRNVAGFLRRAVQEGWTPDTPRQRSDRKLEGYQERYYTSRGYSEDQARQQVIKDREDLNQWRTTGRT